MTLVPFASLVPDVAISAGGCPDPVIEGYLRKSAIRTCERTHSWRMMLPHVLLEDGVWTYKFVGMPDQSEVFTLMGATLNGQKMHLLAPDVMACCFPQWEMTGPQVNPVVLTGDAIYNLPEYDDATLYNGVLLTSAVNVIGTQPQAIGRLSPCDYIVLPKPDAGTPYALRSFVTLRPTKDATGMDDCILGELSEAIVHGALQELLILPGAHWTDRELAEYHAKQYVFKTTERRARANLGFSRGALVAHPQPFGV